MKLYLAGPMTGIPDLNFPAFHAAAAKLRAHGHEVINPAEIDVGPAANWNACMRACISQLATCHGIALLPGWTRSRGARLEQHIAEQLEMAHLHIDGAEKAVPQPSTSFVPVGRFG